MRAPGDRQCAVDTVYAVEVNWEAEVFDASGVGSGCGTPGPAVESSDLFLPTGDAVEMSRSVLRTAAVLAGPRAAGAAAIVLVAGCATLGGGGREYAHRVEYRVSCGVRAECRVQYLDEQGERRSVDVVGEWRLARGADSGMRLWLLAGSGGCPPAPVRAEILVDGETRATRAADGGGGERCEWLTAETEVRLP